jgi:hypothetical protein
MRRGTCHSQDLEGRFEAVGRSLGERELPVPPCYRAIVRSLALNPFSVRIMLCVLAGVSFVSGQTNHPRSLLYGKLLDLTGEPVAGEAITLNKIATPDASAANATVHTNKDGRFLFSGLGVGSYKVTIKDKDFAFFQNDGEIRQFIDAQGPAYPSPEVRRLLEFGFSLGQTASKDPVAKLICLVLKEALNNAGVLTMRISDVTLEGIPDDMLREYGIRVSK